MSKIETDPRGVVFALLNLTRSLTDDRPLEEALHVITDVALALLPADHASLRLLDPGNTALLTGARSGVGTDHQPITFAPGEGVMGWAVESAQSVRVDDVKHEPRFVTAPNQGFVVGSMLVEPLRSAGRVIGVLSVSSEKPHTFSDEDQLLCRLLANCSVPPIERARLERLALTDDTTLAFNVRYMFPRLREEMERSRRMSTPLSVLLMDLDHFKKVNDQHGHAVGDRVLRQFTNEVRAHVRRIDALVRRGGEEFLLILPNTGPDQATTTADRIRQNFAKKPIDVGHGIVLRQTVSIGVATWDGYESPEDLERRADEAMYVAKRTGRDRVSVSPSDRPHTPPPPPSTGPSSQGAVPMAPPAGKP